MQSETETADLKRIGENIRALKAKNFSQEGFTDAVGLHRTYMGDGEHAEWNLSTLNFLKILRKLEAAPREVFAGVV